MAVRRVSRPGSPVGLSDCMKTIERIGDIPGDRPLYIYGAGRAGRLMRELLEQAGGFDIRGHIQTSAAAAAPAGVISLDALARIPGPKSVVIASQWVYEIHTLLHISGVEQATVFNAWHHCMHYLEVEDRKATFIYYFRTYGGFDLAPPRQADYVLVGDSFAYHLGWATFLDPARFADRSVPGIRVKEIEHLLPYCFALLPKTIFLFAGWVDLTERTCAVFPALLDEMRETCSTIARQGVRPVVLSLIPMAPAIAGAARGANSVEYFNRCVAYFNRQMASWCDASGPGAFIDVAALLSEGGALREEFAAKDGAHLNRPAARVIADTMRGFLGPGSA